MEFTLPHNGIQNNIPELSIKTKSNKNIIYNGVNIKTHEEQNKTKIDCRLFQSSEYLSNMIVERWRQYRKLWLR